MKRFDGYIGAIDATLQERPKVFDSVRMDLAVNIFFSMIDNVMHVLFVKPFIRRPAIREYMRSLADVSLDVILKRLLIGVSNNHRSDFAMTREQAHNGNLADSATALDSLLAFPLVHVPRFAADVRFVNLDVAGHFLEKRSSLHRETDSLQHEPCSLLRDANRTMDFIATDSILRARNQPDRRQPLIQTERRILENRSDFGRELPLLVGALTLPFLLLRQKGHVIASARRTDNAVRPAARSQVAQAIVRIREVKDRFCKRLWSFVVCHSERRLAQST